jgi:peptidoglycan/xylan/chitin deacetylase (PgdA/CDA1 family)
MGFYIGAHSVDHAPFWDLPKEDQRSQTIDSLRFIKDSFGLTYSLFAFPHSDLLMSEEFFHSIEDVVDLTFGTCGIKKDPIASNLQRINFERTLREASAIVARQLLKKAVYGRSKSMMINRNIPT